MTDFRERLARKVRQGRALHELGRDPSSLLDAEEISRLYARGDLTLEEMERAAEIAARREAARDRRENR